MSGFVCATCGTRPAEPDRFACTRCRLAFESAQRSAGFLPTVELFPELAPPRPAVQAELEF